MSACYACGRHEVHSLVDGLRAEVEKWKQAELALGAAYIRVRNIIGAVYLAGGPSSKEVWQYTETTAQKLVAEVARLVELNDRLIEEKIPEDKLETQVVLLREQVARLKVFEDLVLSLRLRDDMSAVQQERDNALEQVVRLTEERESLLRAHSAVANDRRDLTARVDELTKENARLTARNVSVSWESPLLKCSEEVADALVAVGTERNAATYERDQLIKANAELTRERDTAIKAMGDWAQRAGFAGAEIDRLRQRNARLVGVMKDLVFHAKHEHSYLTIMHAVIKAEQLINEELPTIPR